jgi:hypothetical protein
MEGDTLYMKAYNNGDHPYTLAQVVSRPGIARIGTWQSNPATTRAPTRPLLNHQPLEPQPKHQPVPLPNGQASALTPNHQRLGPPQHHPLITAWITLKNLPRIATGINTLPRGGSGVMYLIEGGCIIHRPAPSQLFEEMIGIAHKQVPYARTNHFDGHKDCEQQRTQEV